MFSKKCLLFYILSFSFEYIFCENILRKVISNPVIISDRESNVKFALSKNCSENMFEKLLFGFIKLENQIQKDFDGEGYKLGVNFGGYNFNFTKSDNLNETYSKTWCLKSNNCFERSLIEDLETFSSQYVSVKKPCPEGLLKEFTVIISDTCLPKLNKELNDKNDCSMEFRKITLMLPTKDDVEKCEKEILNSSSNKLFIDLYSVDQIDFDSPTIIQSYSDMNVMYYSSMVEAKVNIMILQAEYLIYSFNFKYFPFEIENIPLCEKGSVVGYFQYMTPNGTSQRSATITSPLNYKNNSYIIKNYQNEIIKAEEGPFQCTQFLNEFFVGANTLPANHEQYNILRYLEIIILYEDHVTKDYSKFITFPNNSLNHYTFYEPEREGFADFWNDTTVCKSETPFRELKEASPVTSATTKEDVTIDSVKKRSNKTWIIIGSGTFAILILTASVIIFLFCYNKTKSNERLKFIREKADSISSISKIPMNGKYWPMLLNDKDIVIYSDKKIGTGLNSIVFKAMLTQTNAFQIISTEIVAAKISIKNIDVKDLNVIINELNTLVILKEHPNIIQLKGWTLTGSIPVIVTEMAETNLLQFIKNYPVDKNKHFDSKFYLQILYQICGALKYIHEHRIIHRDIACRNILLTEKRIAKLADFGLSCQIKNKNGIYKENLMQNHRFPLKWLSIEALLEGKFSEKSDIWAFGILCYEIFSNGLIPYDAMSHQEMIEFLQTGQRLEKPIHASKIIFEIMNQCWDQEPQNRGTFKEIQSKIEISLEYSYLPLKQY